jgi:hypothetical protein
MIAFQEQLLKGEIVSRCSFPVLQFTGSPINQRQRLEKLGSGWLVDMKVLTADEFQNLH